MREGLLAELELDVIERFASKATLIATIVERDDWHMSEGLAAGLASAEPPIDGRDHVRLRMFRAAASPRA